MKNFLFEEYKDLNGVLLTFVNKLVGFLIKEHLIQNMNIMLNLMNLINLMMGMDEYNSKMLHTDTWLNDHKNLYKNPYTNWQNSPRFINIIVSTLEFYKRIYCYTYNITLDSSFRELKDLVMLLIFHPYDKVSVEAEITINKICACY